MKKVKFISINNQKLLEVFSRYSDSTSQNKESSVNSSHLPLVESSFIVRKITPKVRKTVFSTGRHLFTPAKVKEIKIRFVLNR